MVSLGEDHVIEICGGTNRFNGEPYQTKPNVHLYNEWDKDL